MFSAGLSLTCGLPAGVGADTGAALLGPESGFDWIAGVMATTRSDRSIKASVIAGMLDCAIEG